MTDDQKHQIKECTEHLETAMVRVCLDLLGKGYAAAAVNAAYASFNVDPGTHRIFWEAKPQRLHS